MYTIVVGNPWDGMRLWGVFDDFDSAENIAFHSLHGEDWWIKEIEPLEPLHEVEVSGNI